MKGSEELKVVEREKGQASEEVGKGGRNGKPRVLE